MCNTAVLLGFGQSFDEVGHKTFTTILHLEHYTTNLNIAGVGVDDELFPWLRVPRTRAVQNAFISAWRAVSASADH